MNYRCKHNVEAMQWHDTDENREKFYTWFDSHDAIFETRGPVVVLPDGDHNHVAPGEWILWMEDGEFAPMDDEQFRDTYERFDSSEGEAAV